MSTQQRMERVIEQIRAEGGRITAQRLAIIRVVFEDPTHPTIEQIHQRVTQTYPATSIATVYKTIGLLRQMGEVAELGMPSRASHFDGLDKPPHAHLACVRCGRVWDLGVEPSADDAVAGIASGMGFELVPGAVEFHGICQSCRRQIEAESTAAPAATNEE